MTGEGKRLIVALVAVAVATGSLGACGDSDSNSDGGSTSTEAKARDTAFDGSDPADVETPLVVSGGGSEQFLVKGGDNSIAEYGGEGDESELEEAAELVHGFYVARATGGWSEACSRMSRSLRDQLEQLSTKSEVRGCAPFLEAFTTKQSDSAWRELTTVDAVSFRHDGEQGFLIYRGPKDNVYAMPLSDEGGEWKVSGLSATPVG